MKIKITPHGISKPAMKLMLGFLKMGKDITIQIPARYPWHAIDRDSKL